MESDAPELVPWPCSLRGAPRWVDVAGAGRRGAEGSRRERAGLPPRGYGGRACCASRDVVRSADPLRGAAAGPPAIPAAGWEYIEVACWPAVTPPLRAKVRAGLARGRAAAGDDQPRDPRAGGCAGGAAESRRRRRLWSGCSAQRAQPRPHRRLTPGASRLGRPLPGMSEGRPALRPGRRPWCWSVANLVRRDAVARLHGRRLAGGTAPTAAPCSPRCLPAPNQAVGKATNTFERALGIAESPAARWCAAMPSAARATPPTPRAALPQCAAPGRAEASEPPSSRGPRRDVDTCALVVEERSAHGVPRLPGS